MQEGAMITNRLGSSGAVVLLLSLAATAWAAADEKTITGVISGVNSTTRIATITPANGSPLVVQFAFNAGGPCNACLGSGRSGPTFADTVNEGSTWTLTYTSSVPAGTAAWFPGGTVNTVYRAVPVRTPASPQPQR
jgi:hypothetical protein